MKPPQIVRHEKDKPINIQIPECCKNGDPNCPHVTHVQKGRKKTNVGL